MKPASHVAAPSTLFRKNYTPPAFWVKTVEMGLDLDPHQTHIATRLTMQRNVASKDNRDIILWGSELQLKQLRMNGLDLSKKAYRIQGEELRIFNAPDEVVLEIETVVKPDMNKTMSGLYISSGNFITQCEAEGFRKMTYYPDRPDVMAEFTVMLRANKKQFPVLLSNGNLIEQGDLPHGRHYAKWHDPFKKPSYLFALVAGQLNCQEEWFSLKSGRQVLLQVWVEPFNQGKTQHAMTSLKKSIRWDEERYGLELDLDRFMIVATHDFNMGAMENKGLNIFNAKYVLANPQIATDTDYLLIESIVGHEYFHNWTGNRVTCRDWFQLSLKEGLTVYRDQEFSGDMAGSDSARAVKRIEDVRYLRQHQFSEDAGPMAHPIRPDSYEEINNFYTLTVYEKGAEVVRMYETLLGKKGFRKGMDLYFKRHDGQAVSCDDFRAAMADANQRDFTQFERWYSQAGTPRVKVKAHYDAHKKTYTLMMKQSCPATPGQKKKLPFVIPIQCGLMDAKGRAMPLSLVSSSSTTTSSKRYTLVLELNQAQQEFVFENVNSEPVPSLLRGFSAPVVLEFPYTNVQLAHLMQFDTDPFARWEAGQRLYLNHLMHCVKQIQKEAIIDIDAQLAQQVASVLRDESLDPAFRELMVTLPSESVMADEMDVVDVNAIFTAREFFKFHLGHSLKLDWVDTLEHNWGDSQFSIDPIAMGQRALKNRALHYLVATGDEVSFDIAHAMYRESSNMTDRLAALEAMLHFSVSDEAEENQLQQSLKDFYQDFEKEATVIDKWFALQASLPSCTASDVRKLMQHPAFILDNPNRARSLIFTFCNNNALQFHAQDGSGYALWADCVIALNKINPQVAARLARSMDRWKRYSKHQQKMMQEALKKVAQSKGLSKDVSEIIHKALSA